MRENEPQSSSEIHEKKPLPAAGCHVSADPLPVDATLDDRSGSSDGRTYCCLPRSLLRKELAVHGNIVVGDLIHVAWDGNMPSPQIDRSGGVFDHSSDCPRE